MAQRPQNEESLSPHYVRDESNPIPPKRRRSYPCSFVSVVNFVRMRFILYSRCLRRYPPGSSWAFALVHKSWRTKHAARLQPLLATTFPPLGSVSGVEPVETKISSKSVQIVTSRMSSNKRPGTYVRSRLKGGGLIRRGGSAYYLFLSEKYNFTLAISLMEKQKLQLLWRWLLHRLSKHQSV